MNSKIIKKATLFASNWMAKNQNNFLTLLLLLFTLVLTKTSAQIISQYVETDSGSTPKGIEIWNTSTSMLDFSTNNLVIRMGVNGAVPSAVVTVSSGTLAVGDVMVIGSADIGTYLSSKPYLSSVLFVDATSTLTFNGDDSLIIEYGGTVTDVFGTPSSDPGDYWGTSITTKDVNLFLKSGIITGSAGFTDPSTRFSASANLPSSSNGLVGFGLPPNTDNRWFGNTDNDWHNALNWSNGVPNHLSKVTIKSGRSNYPATTSAVTVQWVVMEPYTTIKTGDAFFASKKVTFERELSSDWTLITSPVSGVSIKDFIDDNSLELSGSGLEHGFGIYDNSQASGNRWQYTSISYSGTDEFESGTGYAVKLTTADEIRLQGEAVYGDINTPTLTQNSGSGGTDYNLIANPYMAGYNSKDLADDNSIIKNKTFWIWDGSAYTTHNDMNPIDFIPSEAFFVEADATGEVSFFSSRQKTISFVIPRTAPKTQVKVQLTSEDATSNTQVFYAEGKTTGADYGADSKLFDDAENNFTIFTQLVSDDAGEKLAIQSLPNTNLEELVVPLGVIAEAGKELTFSAEAIAIPTGINVYLEDRINGVFTNLSVENYTLKIASKATGIGQFYLHTTSKRLNTNNVMQTLQNVSIYKSGNQEVTIAGLQAEKTTVRMYSVLGKEVFRSVINASGVATLNLPKVASGVYVVKVSSNLGEATKKITL